LSNPFPIKLLWIGLVDYLLEPSKVNQLKLGINMILIVIVLLSALIFAIFSSLAAKKYQPRFPL